MTINLSMLDASFIFLNLIVVNDLREVDSSLLNAQNLVRYVKASLDRFVKCKAITVKLDIQSNSMLCLDILT